MRIPRVYIDPSEARLAVGAVIESDQRVANYLRNALRLKSGAALVVFDGSGADYAATLTQVSRKTVQLTIQNQLSSEAAQPLLPITLAIGVSKGERMDWVIQKATELGVCSIQPLLTERVEVRLDESRLKKRLLHWRNIAIAACEQSRRRELPAISEPVALGNWLVDREQNAAPAIQPSLNLVLALECQPLKEYFNALGASPLSASLLIGPEGGLSPAEIDLASDHGFAPVSLGDRVLRTETAPVVIVSLLQYLWGDIG